MQLHDIITLYYTFIHIVPFDLLIFYLFRKNLRLSIQKTALGYSLLIFIEWLIQSQLPSTYDPSISLWFQFVYAVYDVWAIQAPVTKILAIGFLTIPIELLSYTCANLMDKKFPLFIEGLSSSLTITFIYLLFLPFALRYIRTVLQPLASIRSKRGWKYLLFYESALIFTTICIDPMNQSVTPRILTSRVLLFIATLSCIHVMRFLCLSIRARSYTSQLLNNVQALQLMERQQYDRIMQAWLTSRRLRHDLRHHVVSIRALLEQKDYPALQEYLEKLLSISVSAQDTAETKEGASK